MTVMGSIQGPVNIFISWCFINVRAGGFEKPGNYPNKLGDILNYADNMLKSHLELISTIRFLENGKDTEGDKFYVRTHTDTPEPGRVLELILSHDVLFVFVSRVQLLFDCINCSYPLQKINKNRAFSALQERIRPKSWTSELLKITFLACP